VNLPFSYFLARQAYYVFLILFMLSYHIARVTESITLLHPFITVESEAMDVLNRAVTLSTQKCFSRVEGQWLGFISSRFSAVDPWFNDVSQRCKRVVLITFMKYMSSCNHSISTVMGGLRHLFRVRLADLSIFEDGVIRGARKALKPRGREVSIRIEQRMRAPFTLEMLKWARSQYWLSGSLEIQMTYLGASL